MISLRKLVNFDFFLNVNLIFHPKYLMPDYQIDTILDLDPILNSSGLKGLIFDVDQTILPFRRDHVSEEFSQYLQGLAKQYPCCLLSNVVPFKSHIQRVKKIERELEIKAIFADKKKPSSEAFQQALDYLKLAPEETVMIGDRIFTDIIGANQLGMKTVLVKPLNRRTDPILMVSIPRFVEEFFLKLIQLFSR